MTIQSEPRQWTKSHTCVSTQVSQDATNEKGRTLQAVISGLHNSPCELREQFDLETRRTYICVCGQIPTEHFETVEPCRHCLDWCWRSPPHHTSASSRLHPNAEYLALMCSIAYRCKKERKKQDIPKFSVCIASCPLKLYTFCIINILFNILVIFTKKL